MTAAERVCNLLDDAYGVRRFEPHNPPLDELILTVLSQNTSGETCWRAYRSLRDRFRSWDDVLAADGCDIADAIRCGGLADTKAGRIREILRRTRRECGSMDLSWLAEIGVENARLWLMSLGGVGPKTAACVLLFSFGLPVLPVDTHVWRVSARLGLIGEGTSAERAHEELAAVVPPERVYSFHLNMVHHGREVCRASNPRCDRCPLAKECEWIGRDRAS